VLSITKTVELSSNKWDSKHSTNGTTNTPQMRQQNPSTTKVDSTEEEEPPANRTTRKRRNRCLNTPSDSPKGGSRHPCTVKDHTTALLHSPTAKEEVYDRPRQSRGGPTLYTSKQISEEAPSQIGVQAISLGSETQNPKEGQHHHQEKE
jgi:hypothetical protein